MKIDILDHGYVKLIDSMGSDLSVVNAARASFEKESHEFDTKDERLLNFLWREGHHSPFRHAALTLEVYAPLMVARQLWKYAVASAHLDDQNGWNESSRRYITEDIILHTPAEWRSAPDNKKQGSGGPIDPEVGEWYTERLSRLHEQSVLLYEALLDSGVAPEQARLALPAYAMYVRWRWTMSLAGLMHVLTERLPHDAQFETQLYAKGIYTCSKATFPKSLGLMGLD